MLTDFVGRIVDCVRHRGGWISRWAWPTTGAALACLAVVAVFRMESSTPNYDPQYIRVLVERTVRFGGSYYSNGIHNKGPLEPFVYEIAARIGGRDGMWLVVAIFALLAALAVGWAVFVATGRAGGTAPIAVTMATVSVAHLTLSEADYAGVLYARNITVALLALAFCLAASDNAWTSRRRRVGSVAILSVAIGLAVQTLFTACFTAGPVLLWAMWRRRRQRVDGFAAWALMPGLAAAAFMSAPVYYRIFRPWRDFADGWWVYARFMSEGTGRSLGSQIGLGWDNIVEYYHQRPVLFIVIQLWVVVTAIRWRRLSGEARGLRVLVGSWFLGGWIEMVLSQRYSSHYYSIVAVPTLLMIGQLVGEASASARQLFDRSAGSRLLPIVGALIAVQIGGPVPFSEGLSAAATIRSVDQFESRREVGIDGRVRLVRATLDLVSKQSDPLLMWTSYPWPYLNLQRVSATRYIWKSFLLGEIYLGNSGPEYVLPGTWDRFQADLNQTDPTAYVVESVNPVVAGTPFEEVVATQFTTVFTDDVITLAFRNDLAEWLLEPPNRPAPFVSAAAGPGVTELMIGSCARFDGQLDVGGKESLNSFEFGDMTEPDRPSIAVAQTAGGSLSIASVVPGFTGHAVTAHISGESTGWTLVVGARAAVLVIGDAVVGAVELAQSGPVTLVDGWADAGLIVETKSNSESLDGC